MSQRQSFTVECDSVREGAGPVRLHGIVQWPAAPAGGPRPAVVVCHGFKGFMEWGFFPSLAELLVERGFAVVRFNFSGNGMRPGDELVTDLEAFRRSTFSQDRAEMLRVLAAAGTEIAAGRIDPERLALLGHSRGGGASLLAAADPGWRDRLRALVTWSAVSTFDRFGDEAKAEWRRGGVITIANARTGQELPLGAETLEDVENHRQELDLLAAAGRRRAPWLIVHGGDDETVPAAEAESLERHAADPRELRLVAGASHTFGAQHPFAGPTPQLIEAINATQTWLRRHLG